MNLNLGNGNNYLSGWVNIDADPRVKADYHLDLNLGLTPFSDNSVDEVRAFHLLEHLNDLIFIMKEIHRVLKPTGIVHIKVPHWSQHPFAIGDPSHKRLFNEVTFDCFCKGLTGRVIGIDFFFTKEYYHLDEGEIEVKLRPIK